MRNDLCARLGRVNDSGLRDEDVVQISVGLLHSLLDYLEGSRQREERAQALYDAFERAQPWRATTLRWSELGERERDVWRAVAEVE